MKTFEDRLAVVVMWGKEEKLLGIVPLDHGTGEAQANAVLSLLQEFGMIESIIGLSYDTTGSNTGHISGAVVRLERLLGRSLLKLPCRRHMIELHVKHVSKAVSGRGSKGPRDEVFLNFRKCWDNLDKNIENLNKFVWGESEVKDEKAREVLACALDWAEAKTFVRGDYNYLARLLVLYFSQGPPPFHFTFSKPHNVSSARFLQRSIYYIDERQTRRF